MHGSAPIDLPGGIDARGQRLMSRLADAGATAWTDLFVRAAHWADAHEERSADRPALHPGTPATVWAATKAAIGLAATPLTLPAVTVAAMRSARAITSRIDEFPTHLHALAEGRPSPLPGERTQRRSSSQRYLITSDLHRCIAGRLDWPERRRVKRLYRDVLTGYALEGWSLIENGDVEDFWMVGGSTWGALYDLAYLTGGAVGPGRVAARRRIVCEHLDRIVDNNADIYEVLRDEYCASGRYLRTVGNHDDVYADAQVVEHLQGHLPGAEVTDTILLAGTGSPAPDGDAGSPPGPTIDEVDAVITHGHLTDSWNGHGYAALGRYITWLATSLDDLPGLRNLEALPGEAQLERLLSGQADNRLIQVDPRYGGNRRFDSLDEERLFARLDLSSPPGGWPWLVFGHTHFPMLWPLDASGAPVRYANSGFGALEGAFTALEWHGDDAEEPLHLVVWRDTPDGPRRIELVPDGPRLRAV